MIRACLALLAVGAVAGCTGAIGSVNTQPPAPDTAQTITVRSVNWNPLMAPVGHAAAVAELDDATVVFGDAGASMIVAGTVTASDSSVTDWTTARLIPAADGSGTWLVALDGQGLLHRLRARMSFDTVSDLYGLSTDHIGSFADLGNGLVGFSYGTGLAVANGMDVTRYDDPSFANVAGGGGRAAGVATDTVRVFDPAMDHAVSYALPGARFVAFGVDGRLVAATEHALYTEDDSGALVQRFENMSASIHGLVASGTDPTNSRVWFAIGPELGTWSSGTVSRTNGQMLDPSGVLFASPSGDVWYVANGTVARFSPSASSSMDEQNWENNVFPAYARACSSCHSHDGLVNGRAPVELTTYAEWNALRTTINAYVGVGMPMRMPPAGNLIADPDKAAILTWATMTP